MRNGILVAASVVVAMGCDLVAAPGNMPKQVRIAPQPPVNLRYQVDAVRDRVWLLTREGVAIYEGSRPDRTEVLLPGWHWAGEPFGCLPGLAIGPGGGAVISSDVMPKIWQIDPESLNVTVRDLALDADQDKDIGFSGLVYSREQGAFFAVSHAHGSLWRIDAQLTRAQKVQLSEPIAGACGVAERSQGQPSRSTRPGGLCARGPGERWSIDFAPDQRSAFVHFVRGEQSCATK